MLLYILFFVPEEYYETEGQINGDVDTDPIKQCDVIRITGKTENCLKAKQALIDLVPVTIDVEVPFELHRSIIGRSGRDVKELMDTYDVHIVLSPATVKEDQIKITGSPVNVERAREAVLERVKHLEADRKDRDLKSFSITIEVNPEYHPKIIGKRGAVITKIRADHDVQINFPKKGKSNLKYLIAPYYITFQVIRKNISLEYLVTKKTLIKPKKIL